MQCGKYRISAADSEGIRSQSGHAPVTESVSSEKLSLARHLGGPNAGRERPCPRAAPSFASSDTSVRRMHVSRIYAGFCVAPRSPASRDRRRSESRLIRPPSDIRPHRSPRRMPRRGFSCATAPATSCATAPATMRGVECFAKTGKYRRGRVERTLRLRHDMTCPTGGYGGLRRVPMA